MTDDLDDGDDGDDVRVVATPAALAAIDRLRAGLGDPVMFVQSGGCCAGSTPMCFPDGEFVVGDEDVLLGSSAAARSTSTDGSTSRGTRTGSSWTSPRVSRRASRWRQVPASDS